MRTEALCSMTIINFYNQMLNSSHLLDKPSITSNMDIVSGLSPDSFGPG